MRKRIIHAAVFSIVLAMLANCPSPSIDDCNIVCSNIGARLFVTTTDFNTGSTAVLSGAPPTAACITCTWVGSDTAVEAYGTNVYVVNRYGADNIQVLDGTNSYKTIAQFSMGNGSNPQDIAFVNAGKAYVSRLQNASIWVGDPLTGVMSGEIDLSAYADPGDGVPEAARMVIIDNRLFIALQRLYWFAPTDKSSIAVINTDNNQVVTVIDLATTNPVTRLIYNAADSKIYVGCSGGYQSWGYTTPDGGVETISVNTATDTYNANGLAIDEATLGGDINALAMVSATQAYALVSDANFANYLVKFNPTSGAVLSTLLTTYNYIPDLILDGSGYLYMSDRDQNTPGVRIWDTATDTEVSGPVYTGMPPYSLAVLP